MSASGGDPLCAAPAWEASEAPTPLPEALRRALFVRRFGRDLPRAGGMERLAWAVILAGIVCVLAVATRLEPSARGVGTHEQIPFVAGKLAPCGFLVVTGLPCPSCGYTTTFALAAHGRVIDAARNQPFGFLVFLAACTAVPVSLLPIAGQVSLARLSDLWPWRKIVILALVLWVAAWVYKIEMLRA